MLFDALEKTKIPVVGFDGPPPPVLFFDNNGDNGDNKPNQPSTFWQSFLANSLALLVCYGVNTAQQLAAQPLYLKVMRVEVPPPPKNGLRTLNLN
jgi:hypothetical protein